MKKLISFLLLVFALTIFSNTVYAQVRYEDVIEKIHYTDGMSIDPTTGRTIEASREIGSSNPGLKVYIYGDFSETYTKRFFGDTFDYLKNKYPDARFLFRNAVFLGTDSGMQTGLIVTCLVRQSHFWDNLQNLINITDLSNPSFNNIDKDQFGNCLKDKNTKNEVNIEDNLTKYYGFNSLPTIVVQNAAKAQDYSVKVSGAQSKDIFDRAFQEAKDGDLTKKDLEDIKTKVTNLQQDVEKTQQDVKEVKQQQSFLSEQLDQIKQIMDRIIKNLQSLLGVRI